ncbi:MAG: GtrA family protein, partial [Acidothermus cellulolyticus]|nr:GtrA family protein [Acidothermus cellulolyticus]
RYTAGSAICFAVSEITFVALFYPHLLGAKSSSVAASVAGIIPGYWLNRTWTWGRWHRSDFWREVVPYWATSVASAVFAALAIGAVNDATMAYSRGLRTVMNAATYMAVYGLIFVGKYLLFDRLLFPPATPAAVGEPVTVAAEPRPGARELTAARSGAGPARPSGPQPRPSGPQPRPARTLTWTSSEKTAPGHTCEG